MNNEKKLYPKEILEIEEILIDNRGNIRKATEEIYRWHEEECQKKIMKNREKFYTIAELRGQYGECVIAFEGATESPYNVHNFLNWLAKQE